MTTEEKRKRQELQAVIDDLNRQIAAVVQQINTDLTVILEKIDDEKRTTEWISPNQGTATAQYRG